MSITQALQNRLYASGVDEAVLDTALLLIGRVGTLHNYRFFEVTYEDELAQIKIAPPAIAYVRSVGDFYFRHGPEYWYGRVGTPEANFIDREDDRWVRGQFSGGRGLMRATRIEYLNVIAGQKLSQLISEGRRRFDPTKYDEISTGGFWKVAKDLWYLHHNFQFVELNEQAAGTEGVRLYDIKDGDIAVESQGRSWCVQEKTKNLGSPRTYYDRELQLIGQRPLVEGTPGLHIQKAKEQEERVTLTESHPERLGYVIAQQDIPKGATSFKAAIHPDSLPRAVIGGGKDWILDDDRGEFSGTPSPGVSVPKKKDQPGRPWNVRKFAWLQTPDPSVELAVTGFSPPSSGHMPGALAATISLEQGCPVPLLGGGSVYSKSNESYFLPPASRSFGWMPTGVYGGQFGETDLSVRVRGRAAEHIDIGSDQWGPVPGDKRIRMYWSWIEWAGRRRFSRLRGIKEDDLVSIDNYNHLYRVGEVEKNKLDNPLYITLAEELKYRVGGGSQTLDGIWISSAQMNWVVGSLPDNAYCSFHGWPAPDGTVGVPLIIKNFNFNTVNLLAPVAKDIPAGTKLPIWLSTDLDSVTYAYHDFYQFMYELEQWIQFDEIITREAVIKKQEEVAEVQAQLSRELAKAKDEAAYFWYHPPYYVNRRLDDWFPDWAGKYGGTFAEAGLTLAEIQKGLAKLLNTRPPTWAHEEYISLIRYSHRGIPGA